MFNAGDKIQVLSSNVRGSGPRKGSTGYVCTSTIDIFPRVGAVIFITAYFNKFGAELSGRCERKSIIGIVSMDKPVSKLMKNLHGKKFVDSMEEYLYNYMPKASLKGAKTVVGPAPMTDLRKASDDEKMCWLKSRLFAESKTNALRNWLMQQQNIALVPFSKPELYSFIALCGAPKKVIEGSIDSINDFIRMLNIIKAISTFGVKRQVGHLVHGSVPLRRIIADGKIIRSIKEERALLVALVRYMFKPEAFDTLANMVGNDQLYNGRSTAVIINKIMDIREDLVVLSDN